MKRILALGAFVVAFMISCDAPNKTTDNTMGTGTSADSSTMGTGTGMSTDTSGSMGTDTTHTDSLTSRP